MARQRYVYRHGRDGIKAVPVTAALPTRKDAPDPSFEEQMLRAYYDLECAQGARFNPDYGHRSANEIKEAWRRG